MTYRKKLIALKHRAKAKKLEEKQKLAKTPTSHASRPVPPPAKAA